MGFLWQSFIVRRRGAVCLGVVGMMCAGTGFAVKAKADAWQAAVDARTSFEAEPAGEHTKAEYSAVMDDFRAIYHGNPGDAHAARAIEQVAELLAEQGHELADKKSLRDAAGQYEFVAKAYPGGAMASGALGHALELLGPDGAADQAEAYKGEIEFRTTYPRSAAARDIGKTGPVVESGPLLPQTIPHPAVQKTHVEDGALAAGDAAPVVKPSVRRHAGVNSAAPVDDVTVSDAPAPVVRKVAGEDATAPAAVVAVEDKPVSKHMASVTGIRHWSTATYTRVAIDLGDEVEYQAARVENPDRIYFDLHHARLAQELVGKSFAIPDDGFLTRIRAAQFSNDVTRVVLDVHEVGEYSAFLLPNPYRLIIDIHGKAGSRKQEVGSSEDVADQAAAPKEQGSGDGSLAAQRGPVGVSALPPMPVTDGSEAFGLPKKTVVANQGQAQVVAQPRVVIPVKATVAKPVPNSVTSRSRDTGFEVAAVSQQQGRVEATSRPTSQPIVAKSREQGTGNSEQGTGNSEQASDDSPVVMKKGSKKSRATVQAKVDAAPVEAAPPTADGETSLVRALGLKIGRIVIDAGHGGHDSGTLGVGGIEEKDVVLDVALRLGKLLHDRLGAEIVYTRADDTFIPLETRTAIANKAQADLFISIHANSSSDASARGVEVYYLNFTSDPEAMKVAGRENAVSTQSVHELSDLVKKIALKDKIDESKELAGDVDESLFAGITKGNEGLKNRGVKKAPFVVLIGANMPSILAEISFVTNPDDAEQLEKPVYRERVAESLYNGVARYAGGINGAKAVRTTERAAVK
jgi:N-acetylmuramoyl-L-alanine amidase